MPKTQLIPFADQSAPSEASDVKSPSPEDGMKVLLEVRDGVNANVREFKRAFAVQTIV